MSATSTPFETLVDRLVPFMVERGAVPDGLHRLGPIVCASENEQKNFAVRFAEWVDALQGDRPTSRPIGPVDVAGATG